jgi:hypothetical protein
MFVTNWSLMSGLQNFCWLVVVEHVPSRGCWVTLVSFCFSLFWILVMFVSGFYNENGQGEPVVFLKRVENGLLCKDTQPSDISSVFLT